MIEYRSGDIWKSGANTIVIPVNCVGVMGAGLAKQAKDRYAHTQMFSHYQNMCQTKELKLGFYPMFWLDTMPFLCLFPTKHHYSEKSDLIKIYQTLILLRRQMERLRPETQVIAIPQLGCGLGGLKWDVVRTAIEEVLRDMPHHQILVYGPEEK